MNSKTYWIWLWGDFEIHQGMLQNFSREERGMRWPAYWYIEDCYKNVKFERTYNLKEKTTFIVHSRVNGYITINEVKYRLNEPITLDAGKQDIVIYVYSTSELPTVYIEGDVIHSDKDWVADNYLQKYPVGYSDLFTSLDDDPNKINYTEKIAEPISQKVVNNGLLIDFGDEMNATLKFRNLTSTVTICYGESETEALDVENCYYKQENVSQDTIVPKRAFRYIFIPELQNKIDVKAINIFLPMKNKSSFKSNDEMVNRIWNISQNTFKLCSDLFFIDGIKRDRWIWGGDAFQDNYINQYSYFNEDIDARTIIALRGHDEVKQQINTIVDYSLLWIISIYNHYEMTGNKEFVQKIMPRMENMMKYLLNETDEHGFLVGKKDDWIFIDWSEMDKTGAVAGEQMFLLQALKAMSICKKAIGEDYAEYDAKYTELKQKVIKYFWNEDKGAFIDSFESGKNNVTRHANILAVLFNLVDNDKKQKILNNVLLNDNITQITTPYFKFFEQDALCELGQYDKVFDIIKNYWGSMIKQGATTVWEEYDPNVKGAEQYAMYGDIYGKSLCHAWGASPIYLLGKYFLGLRPTGIGYSTFEITPHLNRFEDLHATLPVKDGQVDFDLKNGQLTVKSSRNGGKLIVENNEYTLEENVPVTVSLKNK